MSSDEVNSVFGNKVRVRVMGLLLENDKLLMVNHTSLNTENELWLPPGGGVEFGDTTHDTLKREFLEEVNLTIEVGEMLFGNEFISDDLHAIELLFVVKQKKGNLSLGLDPELEQFQILKEARFMSFSEIKSRGTGRYPSFFDQFNCLEDVFVKRGFFLFQNNE